MEMAISELDMITDVLWVWRGLWSWEDADMGSPLLRVSLTLVLAFDLRLLAFPSTVAAHSTPSLTTSPRTHSPRLRLGPSHSNRLVTSCHTKCIQPNPQNHRYAEGELLKGEAVCIDRCTAKFFEVNKKVGERMQTMGGQAQSTGSFGR